MSKEEIIQKSVSEPDGATSYFIMKNDKRNLSFKQKLHKSLYAFRKKRAIKSIKAKPHSMSEVAEFIKANGYEEISRDSQEYITEYNEMRASFILQYEPHLLGELAKLPELEGESAEDIKSYIEQIELRKKETEKIPRELFDIELRILRKNSGDIYSGITLEEKYGYIGGSACGKRNIKKFNKFFRKVYRYYGVSQSDIDNNTKRYAELVRTLAMR